ncbi:isocitrate lyase/PEP mutase family protein [Streptomyces bathyalis]|uniref:2-methylisocitrate lyase n=1 Tax=Streptomyces bathyalis TaxID=2710756 RepID=A0A7T1TC26_9ACTN|nr:isocitrate lyase/PEP mutase family protein [Streptomyces bathyalis]QPP10218.1 isocitrate lyase/PEP mutase family protein [Streptomyces bathyalis]
MVNASNRASRTPAGQLRELLTAAPSRGPLLAPGAYDALSARLVADAGFDCVYMTGFGTTASLIGQPDIGLLTATEMADNARRIAAAIGDTPLIADADTGYGNALNVARTVETYERAGVAGIQLEDQVMPKRCGHMAGKQVIPTSEMTGKIRAACDARRDPDTVIIARTDAVATDGVDAALERARAFRDAGADVLFVEAPTGEADVEKIADTLAAGTPLLFNWAEGGKTPPLPLSRLRELGFALVLYPIGTLLAATAGVRSLLSALRRDGTPAAALNDSQSVSLPGFEEFTDLVGLPAAREREARYT